jgi:hypothetical protein
MDSPNLGTWVDVEKWDNVFRISPGDDHHSRPAMAYDLLQQERNSGIRARPVAPDVEWRQRSVVIEQQYRMGCLGDSLQKRRELGLHFWLQTRCSFLELVSTFAAQPLKGRLISKDLRYR